MQTLRAMKRLLSLLSLRLRVRVACRQNRLVQLWRLAPFWSLALVCSASGCTILFDSGRTQCSTDSDCRAVGLLDGTCIDSVCQPITRPPSSMTMSTGTLPATPTTPTTPAMPSAGFGGDAAPSTGNETQGPSTGVAGVGPGRSNERPPRGSERLPDDDGGIVTGTSGTSGAGTPCEGPNCECKTDADCSALGIAGGQCVEGSCWEPTSECTTDDECVMRGPEFVGGRCQDRQCEPNPKWRCDPPPPASASDMRELTLPVIDALALRYLADVPIVACNKLDFTCMNPIAMVRTNMEGEAKLTVPANFAGYMQQTERADYVPAMYFMPALLPADGRFSNFPLVPNGSFGGLALALGTSVDRERGHAMLIIEDCQGLALAGVRFSSPQADMGSTEFYVIDQIPTTSATETPPEGDGGFANLPAGPVEITATEVKTGLIVNRVTMLIRAGMITTAYIKPASRGSTTTGRFPLGP
jgi:hypothetical protein